MRHWEACRVSFRYVSFHFFALGCNVARGSPCSSASSLFLSIFSVSTYFHYSSLLPMALGDSMTALAIPMLVDFDNMEGAAIHRFYLFFLFATFPRGATGLLRLFES